MFNLTIASMETKDIQSNDEEEFLDYLFKESAFLCANCFSPAEVDEDQTHTYCEFCEAYTEVTKDKT